MLGQTQFPQGEVDLGQASPRAGLPGGRLGPGRPQGRPPRPHAAVLTQSRKAEARTARGKRARPGTKPASPEPQQQQHLSPAVQERLPAAAELVEQALASSSSAAAGSGGGRGPAWLAGQHVLLRRLSTAGDAGQALDLLLQDPAASRRLSQGGLAEADCQALIAAALQGGNAPLALSVYEALCTVAYGGPEAQRLPSGGAPRGVWPAASLDTVYAVVTGLARALRVKDALSALATLQRRGVPSGDEVPFGAIVMSPLSKGFPLTLVQPGEGIKVVACAESRYEFEVFSGEVLSASSEALEETPGWLQRAARLVRLWRQPGKAAVHALNVRTPGGRERTFRFSTATPDVPAQVGERVSVVSAPPSHPEGPGEGRSVFSRPLGTNPPGTRPGQPLSIYNHTSSRQTPLQLAPQSQATTGLPRWALPAAVLLAGSDAATGLIDPVLPGLVAAGAVAAAGSVFLGTKWLVPVLKRLPSSSVELAATRSSLLSQHALLGARLGELADEAGGDVQQLARLSQLHAKMGSLGSSGAYGARLTRVANAMGGIESRLRKRLELIDGYARVGHMIEIEVEMEAEVEAAEVADIAQQLARLEDLQSVREEWRLQTEAQEEVERLLRAT